MPIDVSVATTAHDYLVARGATQYSQEKKKKHPVLQAARGSVYSLPVHWDTHREVLVHLPAGFPYDAPCVFLATGFAGSVIPHVDHRGYVCTLPPGVTLNATNEVGIVKAVLDRAETLLTRSYSEQERAAEIGPEIYAYWNEAGAETILLSRRDFEKATWFALEPDAASRKTLLRLKIQPSGSLVKACGILNLTVPTPQTLLDQQTLLGEIAGSPELARVLGHLRDFCQSCKCHLSQQITLCFVLNVKISAEQFLFGMELKNPLKTLFLRRPLPRLIEEVTRSLVPFRRLPIENISSDRLVQRSATIDSALAELRVAMVGCGSLGGFVADGLTRSGVGRMYFVDEELLDVPNLARHLLTSRYLRQPKATGLKAFLRDRFTDLEIDTTVGDITDPAVLRRIVEWKPTIVLSTTGDNNADFALSKATQEGQIPLCAFAWVEPRLAAGHLVVQPASAAVGLRDLHELTPDGHCLYRHRVIASPSAEELQESGCQTNYTPYSGLDLIRFAADLARFGITHFANEKPSETTAWTWLPHDQPTWKENGATA